LVNLRPFVFELGARAGRTGGQDPQCGRLGRPHNNNNKIHVEGEIRVLSHQDQQTNAATQTQPGLHVHLANYWLYAQRWSRVSNGI